MCSRCAARMSDTERVCNIERVQQSVAHSTHSSATGPPLLLRHPPTARCHPHTDEWSHTASSYAASIGDYQRVALRCDATIDGRAIGIDARAAVTSSRSWPVAVEPAWRRSSVRRLSISAASAPTVRMAGSGGRGTHTHAECECECHPPGWCRDAPVSNKKRQTKQKDNQTQPLAETQTTADQTRPAHSAESSPAAADLPQQRTSQPAMGVCASICGRSATHRGRECVRTLDASGSGTSLTRLPAFSAVGCRPLQTPAAVTWS